MLVKICLPKNEQTQIRTLILSLKTMSVKNLLNPKHVRLGKTEPETVVLYGTKAGFV